MGLVAFSAGAGAQGQKGSVDSVLRAAATFKAQLLDAISRNRRREVARMFNYPMRVHVPGLPNPVAVNDSATLLQVYDSFFTPRLRCAIEESRAPREGMPPPKYALLVADGTVSLANGSIIAQRTPNGFKIFRMTVIGTPAPPNSGPRQVSFLDRRRESQYSGVLAGDGIDSYLVSVREGELLHARIERFPGRTLSLRVIGPNGSVLAGASTEYARTWSAPVQETGQHRVQVMRRAAYCDAEVSYALMIAVRR